MPDVCPLSCPTLKNQNRIRTDQTRHFTDRLKNADKPRKVLHVGCIGGRVLAMPFCSLVCILVANPTSPMSPKKYLNPSRVEPEAARGAQGAKQLSTERVRIPGVALALVGMASPHDQRECGE